MIIRSSKHYLNDTNTGKYGLLEQAYDACIPVIKHYIDLMVNGKLPIKSVLTSTKLPEYNGVSSGIWKQSLYATASAIVKSNIKKSRNLTFKRFQKVYAYFKERNRMVSFTQKRYKDLKINHNKRLNINPTRFSITLDQRMVNMKAGVVFDHFLQVKVPFTKKGYKNQLKVVNLPIKEHIQSLKFSDWDRKTTVRLSKDPHNDKLYITLLYEKEEIPKLTEGKSLGFDIGYKKLLADSEGNYHGVGMQAVYDRLANKKRGSKKYNGLLKHKNQEINRITKQVNLLGVANVVVEELLDVKRGSKLPRKFNNKLQYWSYRTVLDKLESRSEVEGFHLVYVDPAYTSQTCSCCGVVDKSNRQGEIYSCSTCGTTIDADYNASINILHRGIFGHPDKKNQVLN